MNKKTNPGLKIICLNRKASFNYFFEDLFEAGIVLKGSEIKSVREGKVNIAESYAVEKGGEIVLINSHISPYKQASYSNHNPTDDRKLLLNKKEIKSLGKSDEGLMNRNLMLSGQFLMTKGLQLPKVFPANMLVIEGDKAA